MQKLFTCLYGSRLYGTQTPTSDLDVKHIVLPPLEDMLIGKPIGNKVKKTNTEKNVRNGADDVDEEFLPIQVFARDFLNGQTYALELAFALEGDHAEQMLYDETAYKFKMFVLELRKRFLTSNIKAMMGYAVNQASLYSFKGERLNVVRDVKKYLEMTARAFVSHRLGDCMLEDKFFAEKMDELTKQYPKYFKREMYDIGGGEQRPCFKLLEKTLPFTDAVDHSLRVVHALEKRYGTRADEASATNVDWKATMHALRIVDEGLQLLSTSSMTFPFAPDYVARLLSIKRGEVPLDEVTAELHDKLDALKTLELNTKLKPLTQELVQDFEFWLKEKMKAFYNV